MSVTGKRVAVIGGGITGLSAAYYLSKMGVQVTLFESEDLGGLAGSFQANGYYVEKYYHHLFSGQREIIDLIKELGLAGRLIWKKVKMGFFCNGQLYPFVSPMDLLRFKPLRPWSRLRLGLATKYLVWCGNWERLEGKTALGWLQKYCGEEATSVVWEPLLRMKYGDSSREVAASWLLERVTSRSRTRTIYGTREQLGYLSGGFQQLIHRLALKIRGHGGEIHTGSPVHKVEGKNKGLVGLTVNGRDVVFDGVLATVPIPIFLQICPGLPVQYRSGLQQIDYQAACCLVLRMGRRLSDYYWINITDPKIPFVALIELNNLVSEDIYGDSHYLYLARYQPQDTEDPSLHKEEIYKGCLPHLQEIFPHFEEKDILDFHLFYHKFAQPVFVRNFSHLKPSMNTPIKGLFLAETSQVYPESRSMNTSVKLGLRAARALYHHLGQATTIS